MPGACRRTFNFSDFALDADEHRLFRGTSEVPLRPRSFATLLYLVERHGHVVSKTELLDTVWNGAAISEGAVSGCIRDIRRALGDDARQPRYIETRARIGYTFVAEVVEIEEPHRPVSIAVLPFLDFSGECGLGRFSAGLTEEVNSALTQIPGLHVAASTSSFAPLI